MTDSERMIFLEMFRSMLANHNAMLSTASALVSLHYDQDKDRRTQTIESSVASLREAASESLKCMDRAMKIMEGKNVG